uniref:IP06023p n=1 Tax=Drosophila melanogaster TaxID=7227 RepID=Q1RKS0_DROME|nr:IP06023p [Drosophila melanogaster]
MLRMQMTHLHPDHHSLRFLHYPNSSHSEPTVCFVVQVSFHFCLVLILLIFLVTLQLAVPKYIACSFSNLTIVVENNGIVYEISRLCLSNITEKSNMPLGQKKKNTV